MHPLVRGAIAVGILALIGLAARERTTSTAPAASRSALAPLRQLSGCPPRHVPDPASGACLPIPASGEPASPARLRRLAGGDEGARGLRSGLVPRLPDRPEPYDRYLLPVDPVHAIVPLEGDPGAERLALRLETERDAPVTLVELEGQHGRAEALLVGQLRGITVAVLHRVRTGQSDDGGAPRERRYLALYGNLSRPGPHLTSGATLSPLEVIGFAGDDPYGGRAHLDFELRLVPEGVTLRQDQMSALYAATVPVDPRNVLPFAP